LLAKALQSMREAGDVEEAEDEDSEKITDPEYSVEYQVDYNIYIYIIHIYYNIIHIIIYDLTLRILY
jgi:hypothetical protein